MEFELRLYKDELAPQAVVQMPLHSAPVRSIYVVSGGLRLRSGGATATLGDNSAWHNRGAVRVASGNLGAVALRWELAPAGAPDATLEASPPVASPPAASPPASTLLPEEGPARIAPRGGGRNGEVVGGVAREARRGGGRDGEVGGGAARSAGVVEAAAASVLLLSSPISLDAEERWLLRCDRVDFPPGGEALLHTHRGGGIRCLLSGSIEIETRGARHHYRPLEAWFEAGPDPVYAAASAADPTAFVRVMILPRALLGKSSISYVNPEDLSKPKSPRYQVFIDEPVELP